MSSEYWYDGKPTEKGSYVLEFAEGDRFAVAMVIMDYDAGELKIQEMNDGGYISDEILRHTRIQDISPRR